MRNNKNIDGCIAGLMKGLKNEPIEERIDELMDE